MTNRVREGLDSEMTVGVDRVLAQVVLRLDVGKELSVIPLRKENREEKRREVKRREEKNRTGEKNGRE